MQVPLPPDTLVHHIQRPTARACYIVDHLLAGMSGLGSVRVDDPRVFHDHPGPKLLYGTDTVAGAFHVRPSGWLEATGTSPHEPPVAHTTDGALLYPGTGGPLDHDPFAGAFFLLSRYEETVGLPLDPYGRPMANAMHAVRHGYVEQPVVDQWMVRLFAAWRAHDPRVQEPRRRYRHLATMDVDNGFLYRGKPLWRTLGGVARDICRGRLAALRLRFAVLAGLRTDPYAVDDAFREITTGHCDGVLFNYLVAPFGKHDHAVGPHHGPMRERMRAVGTWAVPGLHPGFDSSAVPGSIAQEKQALETALGSAVRHSRQHFLRFRLPATYLELESSGIEEEHSMGFADRVGFRAGTSTAYPYFDPVTDRATGLLVRPFATMDSALSYKEGLTPDAAVARARAMVDAIRAVQGTYIGVWHERFLSDHGPERGWARVVREVIRYAAP